MAYERTNSINVFLSRDCFVASLLAMTHGGIAILLPDSFAIKLKSTSTLHSYYSQVPHLVIASRRLLAAWQSLILDKFEKTQELRIKV